MLRSYPIEATLNNWLNDTILGVLEEISSRLGNGQDIESTQDSWNDLIDQQVNQGQNKASALIARHGIRDRVFAYKDLLSSLSGEELDIVLEAMQSQNLISELLDGTESFKCVKIQFPEVHEAARNLFEFCYERLADLKIREEQYQTIFDSLEEKICPFCGIERVNHPEEVSQDQDHYLAKSLYPFAATNLKNLAPMCLSCNRNYKGCQDILHCSQGLRRKAFNPYNCSPPNITLIHSLLQEEVSPFQFNWEIEFNSENEKAETWASVFSIRERYKRDILGNYFNTWIGGLTTYCKSLAAALPQDSSDQEVRDLVERYRVNKEENPNIGNAGFLEPLVFEMLIKKFDESEPRVIQFMRDAVLGISMESVA